MSNREYGGSRTVTSGITVWAQGANAMCGLCAVNTIVSNQPPEKDRAAPLTVMEMTEASKGVRDCAAHLANEDAAVNGAALDPELYGRAAGAGAESPPSGASRAWLSGGSEGNWPIHVFERALGKKGMELTPVVVPRMVARAVAIGSGADPGEQGVLGMLRVVTDPLRGIGHYQAAVFKEAKWLICESLRGGNVVGQMTSRQIMRRAQGSTR